MGHAASQKRRASLLGWLCPACGHDQRGSIAAGETRCPECGKTFGYANLQRTPPQHAVVRAGIAMANRSLGAIQIMLLLIEVVILIGLAQPSLSSPGTRMPMCLRAAVQIKEVHQATLIQASETGDYISHAALLMAENYYAPELVIDRCSTRTSWLLGNFDISTYDYSVEHELRLRANVAAQDPNAAFYALGDFQFVRLKQPTGDPGIVFGWTHATDPGGRYVVFDDNHTELVTQQNWPQLWNMDARARANLGLPAVVQPSW